MVDLGFFACGWLKWIGIIKGISTPDIIDFPIFLWGCPINFPLHQSLSMTTSFFYLLSDLVTASHNFRAAMPCNAWMAMGKSMKPTVTFPIKYVLFL